MSAFWMLVNTNCCARILGYGGVILFLDIVCNWVTLFWKCTKFILIPLQVCWIIWFKFALYKRVNLVIMFYIWTTLNFLEISRSEARLYIYFSLDMCSKWNLSCQLSTIVTKYSWNLIRETVFCHWRWRDGIGLPRACLGLHNLQYFFFFCFSLNEI
jgi:hypothetical protein